MGIWGKENVREFDARSEVKEMGEKSVKCLWQVLTHEK
jgi:hypothetical protein